jgi:hypothetical protein
MKGRTICVWKSGFWCDKPSLNEERCANPTLSDNYKEVTFPTYKITRKKIAEIVASMNKETKGDQSMNDEPFKNFIKNRQITMNTIIEMANMANQETTKESLYLALEMELNKLITQIFALEENEIDFGLYLLEETISKCRKSIKRD